MLLATTEADDAAASSSSGGAVGPGRGGGGGGGGAAVPAPLPLPEAEAIPVMAATTHAATAADAELASTSGKTRYGPSDFELLRVVGQGAFGKVRLPLGAAVGSRMGVQGAAACVPGAPAGHRA